MRSLQNFEKSILRIYMDGGFKISTLYWFNTGKILNNIHTSCKCSIEFTSTFYILITMIVKL